MVFWMQNTQSSSFRKVTPKTPAASKMLASKQVARKRRFLARKNLSECWPRHVNEMNATILCIILPETFCFSLFLHRHLQKTKTWDSCVCFELILLLFAAILPQLWNQKRFGCNISISFYSKLIVERTKMLSTQLESDRFHSFNLLLCDFGSEFIPFHFHFQQNHGRKTEIMGEIEPIHSFIKVKERNKPNSSWFSSNSFFKSLLPEHFTVYSLYLVLSIVFLSIFNSIFRRFHVNLSCFLENLIFEIHFSLDFCPNFEFAANFLFWNFQVDWKFLPFLCFDQWKFGSLSQIHMIISIDKNIKINEHNLLVIMVNTHMKY